jgi:hypothetical protein
MQSYSFAPGVSACLADGQRLVVLNTRADRYMMLPPPVEASLRRLLDGAPNLTTDRMLRERLCTNGLILRRGDGPPAALCRAQPREGSLIDAGWAPPGPRAVAGAGWHVLRAMAALRLSGLERSLDRVTGITPVERALPVDRTAAAFAELRLVMRSLDRCLPLSLALAAVAKRRHAGVRLVLGVKCSPFGAHAWVQQGRVVLNDRLDAVLEYTPILVL